MKSLQSLHGPGLERFARSDSLSFVRLRTWAYAVICLACLVGACRAWSADCAAPPAGLVSWWRAESNALDQAGTNNGTVLNGASFAPGKVGQAFSFDGVNAVVQVPSSPTLSFASDSPMTVELWAYRTGGASSMHLIGKRNVCDLNNAEINYQMGFNVLSGEGLFFGAGTGNEAFSGLDLPMNAWTHLAGTFDGMSFCLYVNGVLRATNTGTLGPPNTSALLIAGSADCEKFAGLIDEVSIYNRALTAVEVQSIYNAGSTGKCTTPTAPVILQQPTNQLAAAGSNVGLSIIAAGTSPLSYQWRLNGTNLPGASGSALALTGIQVAQSGYYSVQVTNTSGSVTSSAAALVVFQTVADALINVDFGGGPTNATSPEVGPAAAGQATNDFWNFYTRDDGSGGYRYFGFLTNMKLATGSSSGAGLTITNAPGAYPNGSSDPMYNSYVYPFDGRNVSILVTNLPAGPYDFYVYGYDGNYQVQVGGTDYGTRMSLDAPLVNPPVWQEGRQYVAFRGVSVASGQAVTLIVRPGQAYGYAVISGMQIASAGTLPTIVVQPQSQTVNVGANVSFSVTAAGTAPLNYQWRFSGTNLAAATASTLALTNVQLVDAGSYSVLVSNSVGTVLSSNAILTVNGGPSCAPPPPGLIGWWKGDGNGSDSAGTNNAYALVNISFTNGIVGQAFACDPENYPFGTYTGVQIADQPAFALTNSLSIEAWIRPRGTSYVVFFRGDSRAGFDPYLLSMQGNNILAFQITDANGNAAAVSASLLYNQWWHVAGTLDGASGKLSLYTNGILAAQITTSVRPFGDLIPQDSPGIGIGNVNDGFNNFPFWGDIDEVSLYNRALTAAEIQAIYNAAGSGKCVGPNAPVILTQPADQVATVGDDATFSVVATGTPPLSYQWRFNGTNLPGRTGSSLTLSSVQLTDAGTYSVQVTNLAGSVISSNAILVVNETPPCVTPPPDLVSWWKGEGNALDQAGTNNGALAGDTTYGPARVGLGFVFDGSGDGVTVGSATNLQLQDFTIEAWIKRASASAVSVPAGQDGFFFGFGHSGYAFGLRSYGALSLSRIDSDAITSGLIITDTNYHHAAVTKSGTTVVFYLDGTAWTSGPYSSTFYFNTPAAIGARGDTLGNSFLGAVDELAIYSRALSTAEVQAIYNAGSSGKCTGAMAPVIAVQPTNQVAIVGDSVTFSVLAAGTPPLSYQWRFNGTNLTTATANALQLTNVQLADSGSYSVVVSNVAGSVLSSNAILTVNAAPPCTPPPAGLVSWWRAEGTALDEVGTNNGALVNGATFAAGKAGQAFSLDGVAALVQVPSSPALSFATNAPLTVELWAYRTGSATSMHFVGKRNACGLNNADINYQMGFNMSFGEGLFFGDGLGNEAVTGLDMPMNVWTHLAGTFDGSTYCLYVNGVLKGTQAGTLGPPNTAALLIGGSADCEKFAGLIDEVSIYNRALSAVEIQVIYNADRAGKCTVPTPPTILLQPASQTVTAQSNAVFRVGAAGTSPLAYQWRYNGAGIGGETNDTLMLTAVRADQAGSYDVVVTNALGAATSAVAVLTVYVPPPPVFTLQPQSQTSPAGTNVTFTALATDTGPITYQWYFAGSVLAGATGTSLVLTDVQAVNAGDYIVVAANAWNSATSAVATLTVVPTVPILTSQPQSAGVFLGFTAPQLTVAATGTEPFSYQWQLHGTNIPGATNASYVVSNMLPVNAGPYRAILGNSVGSTNSAEAVLALVPVACWGATPIGLASLPVSVTNAVAVSAGARHNLALRRDGSVVAWGATDQTNVSADLTNVLAVSAGSDHSVALSADGTVAAWGGSNNVGQTNVPASLSNVVAIAAGGSHSLALKADGTVVGWGLNASGQITIPAALTNVVAISAGSNHSIALRADGKVFAWGSNAYGQTSVPTNLADVVAIAAGASHSLALRRDGSVAAWGLSSYGQITVPAGLSNVIAIAAGGFHSLAVKSDGTLVAWGAGTNSVPATYPNLGQAFIPPCVTNIIAVSGGDAHTLALAGDGAPFITAPPVNQVSYSGRRVVFRATATGALPLSYQWQLNDFDLPGATNQLLVIDNALDAGSYRVVVTNDLGAATSSVAILTLVDTAPFVISQPAGKSGYLGGQALLQVTADGSGPFFYQWRLNGVDVAGATGSSLVLNHLLANQAGYYSVVVSNAFGEVSSAKANVSVVQVVAWGAGTNYIARDLPNYGQSVVPAGLNNAVAIAGGGYHTLTVKADGKVLAWGAGTNYVGQTPNYGQSIVPGTLPAVAGVAGGLFHSLALRTDGAVAAWGAGTSNYVSPQYGQCLVPVGLSNVVAVAAGDYHSVVLKSDGRVAVWGYNNYGQTNVPTSATNIIAVASRGSHILALRGDGSMVHWGYLTTLPPAPNNYVAIAAGMNHCLGLRSDGTVVSWGGTYPVPPGLSNVVDIAAGNDHSLALKNDGTVVTWGATNTYGRSFIPAGLTNVIGIACGYYHSLAFLGDGSPIVKFPPANRTAYLGAQTNFSVTALGAQPLRYQWQFDGTNLPGATNASLTLRNLQATDAGSYRVVVANLFGLATSAVATLTTLVPLGQALDAPGLVWTTSGNALWAGESVVTHDGLDAAQSGAMTDNQSSTVQTTVSGAGTLSFWWKVSSEEWFDYLSFYIDGVVQSAISGERDWQQQAYSLPSGSHTLRWTYAKDLTVSDGADAGWLDQVTFITNPPVIMVQPLSQHGTMGATLSLRVTASGAPPLSYQWLKDGTNLAGASASTVTIVQATRRDSGLYQVMVSNPGGGTPSSNATVVVRSPQQMGAPIQLPGGGIALASGDADGGPLLPGDLPNFQTQASTNFVDWVALLHGLTVTNGMLLLVDPDCTNYPYRFYRIIELDDAMWTTNPPVITTHPLSQSVSMGATLQLSVAGLGAPPLRYQWLKDGASLAGATATSLSISNASRHHSGVYAAMVSNPVGGTPSSNATVVVRVPERLGAPMALADGTFVLTAGDADGAPLLPGDLPGFQAQASSNLFNWVTLTNSLTLTNGLLLLTDPDGTNYPARYYRIIEP